MTADAPIALGVNGVSKRFGAEEGGTLALDAVSFEVPQNQFVSVVGPSGCGKSTLLMLIAGLEPYSEGAITCGNELVYEPSPSRGVVFQNYSLYPWLTVKGNVEFPLAEQSLNRRERGELAMSHLEQIGLSEFADSYPSQLSGGMRQRVAIARALAARPSLLLMDEPFGALDAQTRELMQELLTRVWEQDRMTVVFITHDVEEAIFLSDRVLLMSARPGRIKEDVTIDLPRPRSFDLLMTTEVLAYKQRLLKSIREEALKSAGGAFGVLSPASDNGRPTSDSAAEVTDSIDRA